MPRPFKKGIACHGSMQTHPFSRLSFVDLNIDNSVFFVSAQHLLEISQHSQSVQDLASAINESDLEMFLFPDDFMTKLFDILR